MGRRTQTTIIVLATLALTGCIKTAKEEALAAGAKQLSGEEAKAALSDSTAEGDLPALQAKVTLYYAADGLVAGKVNSAQGEDHDRGRWRIDDEGGVCIEWSKWQGRRERCGPLWKEGDLFKAFSPQGALTSVFEVTRGNTAKMVTTTALETALKGGARKISAAEAKAAYTGNTVNGKIPAARVKYAVFCSPDGRTAGKARSEAGTDDDTGKWRISDEGEVCFHWEIWEDNKESCNAIYKQGDSYLTFTPEGALGSTAKIAEGNSKKLELDG